MVQQMARPYAPGILVPAGTGALVQLGIEAPYQGIFPEQSH
jgi:hypothetical protein